MADEIRLSELQGDTIVVHFGGAAAINAYTFANSLIGFADTARAISGSIDPGQDIEIVLEADGKGSYRAIIRRVKRAIPAFFREPWELSFGEWSPMSCMTRP